jgi:hypothetical protein
MIRSHSRTLVSSHVIAAFAQLRLRARLGAGSRRPSSIFRLGGAEQLLTESPFTAVRRCIRTKSVAWIEVANGRTLLLLRDFARAGRERKRVEDVVSACEHASPTVSPGSSSPGHLYVTHRARSASEQRDTCWRRAGDLHVRRRFRASATAPYGTAAASVTRPAKGEILVQIEVPSIRPTDSHAWEISEHVTSEVALVVVFTRWLSIAVRACRRRRIAVRKRTQYRGAGAFVTLARAPDLCDGLDTVRGSIE